MRARTIYEAGPRQNKCLTRSGNDASMGQRCNAQLTERDKIMDSYTRTYRIKEVLHWTIRRGTVSEAIADRAIDDPTAPAWAPSEGVATVRVERDKYHVTVEREP